MSWIVQREENIRIHVLLVPRSSRTKIVGIHDERLKILLTAPPVDGKANAALIYFLAEHLKLRRDQFNIAKGLTGRRKTIEIQLSDFDYVKSRLS